MYAAFNAETARTEIRAWADISENGMPVVKVTLKNGRETQFLSLGIAQADELCDKLELAADAAEKKPKGVKRG